MKNYAFFKVTGLVFEKKSKSIIPDIMSNKGEVKINFHFELPILAQRAPVSFSFLLNPATEVSPIVVILTTPSEILDKRALNSKIIKKTPFENLLNLRFYAISLVFTVYSNN